MTAKFVMTKVQLPTMNGRKTHFQGSSPSMESEGILVLWRCSEENLKLRYTTLISDGDVKTHAHLSTVDPYNGVPIEKQDCVKTVLDMYKNGWGLACRRRKDTIPKRKRR